MDSCYVLAPQQFDFRQFRAHTPRDAGVCVWYSSVWAADGVPHKRRAERGKEVCCMSACLPACLSAFEATMACSSDETVESDETVCHDPCNAALRGQLAVARLLPLAEEQGVINKVMHGVNKHTEKRESGERHELERLQQCHVHLISSHLMV